MSANRSVQAAQQRRAGPTTKTNPAIPGRSPQPSINSAQMFQGQGQGQNMPNGRLAGQHAMLQQQQMQQQQADKKNDKLSSKITIAQAITLITLRLGAIETKMMHMPEGHSNMDGLDTGLDDGVLQSIMSRLESLEKRSTTSTNGTVSTPELNLFKQQLETIKQTMVQTKNSTVTVVKEVVSLKTQLENLRKEVVDTKETLDALQNMTMDHNKQLLKLSFDTGGELQDDNNDDILNYVEEDGTEIIGTDLSLLLFKNQDGEGLKQMIENELNMDA